VLVSQTRTLATQGMRRAVFRRIEAMDTESAELAVKKIDDSAPIEVVADALNKVNFIREMERELRKDLTARMISYIRQNGAIQIGTKKWIAGRRKETSNKDRGHTLRSLALAVAGAMPDSEGFLKLRMADLDLLATEFLSANAFRPGACKDALSEQVWGECFEIKFKDELREGKPALDLIELDERFVGNKVSQGTPSQE
jgi:predicted protein tyrosine phosphatase